MPMDESINLVCFKCSWLLSLAWLNLILDDALLREVVNSFRVHGTLQFTTLKAKVP
jgi:hypothetical protein